MLTNFYWIEEVKKKLETKYIVYIIWILLLFSIETIFRQPLFEYSLYLEVILQKSGSFMINMMKFFSFLGTENTFTLILLFVINFDDTYKSFLIFMASIFSTLLTGSLKMMYREARPYFKNPEIFPFNCEAGYGNPSGHSLGSAAIYLTIWRLYFSNKDFKEKLSTLILFLSLIFAIMISRLYMGVHSLNQIFFGFMIGSSFYILVFHILEVDYSKFQTFIYKVSIGEYIIANLIIALLIWVIYVATFEFNEDYVVRIIFHCKNVPKIRMLHNETLVLIPLFLSSVVAFVGIKLDFTYNYHSDMVKWCNENISHITTKYYNNIYSSNFILSHYDTNHQWNNTDIKTSLKRMLILLVGESFCMIPFFLTDFNSSLIVVMIVKLFIPMSLAMLYCFYFFKIISRRLSLANADSHSELIQNHELI
jgi:membrane-associated phospholipid phosphatase